MLLFSQRDPRWMNHALGWGPALGTIGLYGCLDTVFAMIANDAGHASNPASIDELFTAKQIFVRESTGTYDLLPDNALVRAWPDRFALVADAAGFRADLIASAVPSPDTYAYAWISTAAVPTHFVLMYSKDARYIADPWTGRVGTLAGYGGPGAVHKTVLVKALPAVPAAPAPTPLPPPTPIPLPTPIPEAFYSFNPTPPDDLHPPDGVMSFATARDLADAYAAGHPGGLGPRIRVWDERGITVYEAPADQAA